MGIFTFSRKFVYQRLFFSATAIMLSVNGIAADISLSVSNNGIEGNIGITTSNSFEDFRVTFIANPSDKKLIYSFVSLNSENYYLKIHDMTGNEIKSIFIESKQGFNKGMYKATSLRPGGYFISLQNKDKIQTKRIVIR